MLSPLTKLPNNAKVAVIGSGVSGLMFTYYLGKLRPDVTINIFESAKRSGGWINSWQTTDQNGKPIMLERGPRTLRGVSDGTVLIMDTLKDLNQQNIIKCVEKNSEANRKFLLDTNNKLVQVPSSIVSFAKFMINPLSKGLFTGMLGEWFRKPSPSIKNDESVASFIGRRFGNDYIGKNILSAIFHGIYADDINELSAKRTLRDLYALEEKYGSIFKGSWETAQEGKKNKTTGITKSDLSACLKEYQQVFGKKESDLIGLSNNLKKYPMLGLKGGLEEFPKIVRKALEKLPNVNIILGKDATKIVYEKSNDTVSISLGSGEVANGFNHCRITTNPSKMSLLVKSANEKLSQDLDTVKSNTVLLVNYYLPGRDIIEKNLHGFGYLVPKSNNNPQKLLGVIFDSIIEKNFKPFEGTYSHPNSGPVQEYTKLTAMLGGHFLNQWSECTTPSKDIVIKAVKEALMSHLSVSEKDLDAGLWQYTVAERCLPHFFVGYDAWQSSTEQELLNTYAAKVSTGGMGFSKGPGVPDVIVDSFQDAMKLK
ncbi:hypothetical protein HG535_0F02960 [Zygotorulaspora mrakii]|uniref:Protoporphyrinogen oxidase n=1 Tax=Zygotorulaspora mrakii TaxID=42260 RepID=A0A7H9B529_ZYGMR|nr:uncharacterized protein HG535_0F02960 [Zygotorulaspora mrakii]QLG73785.1 hypothetical protein HG535_0F02960 [Zygotorulaspora mrakii]